MSDSLEQLKQFIIDNNIVGTSAGVCVALAAKDGIQSLVGDIIIPAIIILLHTLHIDGLAKYLPVKGHTKLNITDFVKQIVTFILIIIISFIFVKFAFGYLLDVAYTKKDKDAASSASSDTSQVNTTAVAAAAAANSSNKNKEAFESFFN